MGKLYVVATPIGNLADITQRALDVLKSVDIIACEDTRQTLKLLNHYDIKKKLISYHKFNEIDKSQMLINNILSGLDVAIVTDAGTPCISDPGYVLVRQARLNNIEILAIPGASAVVSAISVSGLDAKQFCFIGFLPVDNKKFKLEIEKIKNSEMSTFIIYESPKRIVKLIEKMKDIFDNSQVYIASDLTKIHERGFFGDIKEIYEIIKNDPNIEKGEYVIVLEKKGNNIKKELDDKLTNEALIVNTMIKNNCSLRDAVEFLCSSNIKKNALKEASINLKKMFENI